MSKPLAGFLRTLFFILGAVLIALGVWPILIHFQVEFALYLAAWINHDAWAAVPDQQWWPWALVIGTAVLVIIALWLLASAFKTRRINRVRSQASNKDGKISLEFNSIIGGISESLEQGDLINSVKRKVAYDRGRPQATFIIEAKPTAPWAQLVELTQANERDFRDAFPHTNLDTVYQVHYSKAERS